MRIKQRCSLLAPQRWVYALFAIVAAFMLVVTSAVAGNGILPAASALPCPDGSQTCGPQPTQDPGPTQGNQVPTTAPQAPQTTVPPNADTGTPSAPTQGNGNFQGTVQSAPTAENPNGCIINCGPTQTPASTQAPTTGQAPPTVQESVTPSAAASVPSAPASPTPSPAVGRNGEAGDALPLQRDDGEGLPLRVCAEAQTALDAGKGLPDPEIFLNRQSKKVFGQEVSKTVNSLDGNKLHIENWGTEYGSELGEAVKEWDGHGVIVTTRAGRGGQTKVKLRDGDADNFKGSLANTAAYYDPNSHEIWINKPILKELGYESSEVKALIMHEIGHAMGYRDSCVGSIMGQSRANAPKLTPIDLALMRHFH